MKFEWLIAKCNNKDVAQDVNLGLTHINFVPIIGENFLDFSF